MEIGSIVVVTVLLGILTLRLRPFAMARPGLLLAVVAVAYFVADALSGLAHWAADTWGSVDTPIFGRALIRPFREHHLDPEAITRHDFVETNGNSCIVALPAAAVATLLPTGAEYDAQSLAATFLGSLVVWAVATNQFHKWAHTARPPAGVRWLQRVRLLLPPAHHAKHHAAPFDRNYCITSGWLNVPLGRIGFFRFLERGVRGLTGARPRRDEGLGIPSGGDNATCSG